uniref:Uncharacterized protein n=1 Tax=Knipowitschia caucasica TaxID=637954 RepID=A0AAV2MCT3_KNICA
MVPDLRAPQAYSLRFVSVCLWERAYHFSSLPPPPAPRVCTQSARLEARHRFGGLPRILSCVGTCTFHRAHSPPLAPRAYAQPRFAGTRRVAYGFSQAAPL